MRWFVLLMMLLGCSRQPEPLQPQASVELAPNTYIDQLAEGRVEGDVIVRGVVTTSDSCGNFYQSMMVQDPTGVLELRFAFYDVYTLFRLNGMVSIKLFNRDLRYENGIMSVNMGSLTLATQNIFRQGVTDIIRPIKVSISAIDSTLIGQLVELGGGKFTHGGARFWSGEQQLKVGKESITIYTSPFASYANDYLPDGVVTVRGIVTLFKGKFQLKMSSAADCTQMEGR